MSESDETTTELTSANEDAVVPDQAHEVTPADAPPSEPEVAPDTPTLGMTAEPAPHAPDGVLAEAVSGGLSWIPFALYLGAWLVLAGLTAYLLYDATAEQPAVWLPEYPALVASGVALAVVGPIISLIVWLVARARRLPEQRPGLLASALTRGALAAFFGALLWIVAIYLVGVLTTGSVW